MLRLHQSHNTVFAVIQTLKKNVWIIWLQHAQMTSCLWLLVIMNDFVEGCPLWRSDHSAPLSNKATNLSLTNDVSNLYWEKKASLAGHHSIHTPPVNKAHGITLQSGTNPLMPLLGHYRETSSASFPVFLTGIVWTLSRLRVKIEAGILEGIGRGFMAHSAVLQNLFIQMVKPPNYWPISLEDMNWLGMIGDLMEFQGRGTLVNQGKRWSKHTHGPRTTTAATTATLG